MNVNLEIHIINVGFNSLPKEEQTLYDISIIILNIPQIKFMLL